MFVPQQGWFSRIAVPRSTEVPHTMFCAQGSRSPAMTDAGSNPAVTQTPTAGTRVSIRPASSTAPAALIAPPPCVRWSNDTPRSSASRTALYCRTALTAFGDNFGRQVHAQLLSSPAWREDSSTSATTPVVTAAPMLVPLSLR